MTAMAHAAVSASGDVFVVGKHTRSSQPVTSVHHSSSLFKLRSGARPEPALESSDWCASLSILCSNFRRHFLSFVENRRLSSLLLLFFIVKR